MSFLCVYYYRMISLQHGHPWKKPNGGPHGRHTYLLDTGQHLGSEKNTQYENDERSQHSWDNNPTKTWTLDEHQRERLKMNCTTMNYIKMDCINPTS